MGLISRIKTWVNKEILTHTALNAEFTNITDSIVQGTTSAKGMLELNTDAETVTGTDTARATTAANITAKMAAPGAIGGTTPAAGAFTSISATGEVSHIAADSTYNDNYGTVFGTGDDAEIYYNSTNLVINPNATGSGKVLIGVTGDDDLECANLTANGDITVAGTVDGVDISGVISIKTVVIKVIADDTTLETGDGLAHFTIPIELNGMNLISVGAHVYTVSSSGLPTFMVYNLTDSSNMLSTAITIDETEKDSKDADTPAVIDTGEDDVVTGDELRFDCTTAGTDTTGMEIRLGFRL